MTRPHDGVVLRVACPDAVTRDIVRECSLGWSHRTGARVEVIRYEPARGETPAREADLWIVAAGELPHWAAAGQLEPLPEAIKRDEQVAWPGLLPLYREQLLVWDSAAYGLPLLGDAPICFYRKDLLRDPRHQEAFRAQYRRKLQPPATWEEFALIAEYFRGAIHKEKPGPSLPPLPADQRELDTLFYLVAASTARRVVREDEAGKSVPDEDLFTFHFDLKTGRPRIGTPGFVAALEMLKRLSKCRPAERSPEPWRAFARKEAVLCLDQCRRLEEFQREGSLVRDKVGVCLVPGSDVFYTDAGEKRELGAGINRVPYMGAGAKLMVVPRSAAQPEIALALMAELGGRVMSQQIVLEPRWGGGVVRQIHLDRQHWDAYRLEPEEGTRLRETIRQTLQHHVRNPVLCLRVPSEPGFVSALSAGLRKALGGEGTAGGQALAEAARRWDALIGPRQAEHLREYRLSLRLPTEIQR